MRAVIQRVASASVLVAGEELGAIERGLLVLLGVAPEDTEADVDYLVKKISSLRIFPDEIGKMNKSVQDIGASVLVVSQFTLFASYKKGTRPGFSGAASAELGARLYNCFKERLSIVLGRQVPCGRFGADMQVSLTNDGPVTICMDSHRPE